MGRREHFDGGAAWTPADKIPIVGSVHLPPTPQAIEHIQGMQMEHRMHQLGEEIERKDKAVKTAKARNSPYALGSHKAIKKHLEHDHGAWPEDVAKDHGELARWHKSWHGDSEHDHTH